MEILKKFLSFGLASLFSLLAYDAFPQGKAPLNVTALLPLTGDYAPLGNEIRKGIEIGLDEAGLPAAFIHVDFEDAGTVDRKKAVNASRRAIDVNRAVAAFSVTASESVPLARIFQEAHIPLIVLWDSNKTLLDTGDYIFSTGFSNEETGYAAADFLRNKLQRKNCAVVENPDPYSAVLSNSFSSRFIALGGEVVQRETVSSEGQDFRSALVRVKEKKPESIFFPLVAAPSTFLRQARDMKIDVPFITGETMLIPGEVEAAGSAAEGVYFLAAYTDDSEHLQKLCNARYGAPCADILSVSMGYEGVRILAKAVKDSDGRAADLQQSLVELTGSGRSLNRQPRIYQINGGAVHPAP